MRLQLAALLSSAAVACGGQPGPGSLARLDLSTGAPVDGGIVNGPPPQSSSTGLQPQLGPTVTQADPPPALAGGTLLALHDGATAVAADADRDLVYVVDVPSRAVRTVPLLAHDEPGRVVEDRLGHAYVALRRGGAVATIDVASATVLDRRAVCAAPRGLAWDAPRSSLWVACAGGELVQLPWRGPPVATYRLQPDLRDVVADASGVLYVSTLRDATLLRVDPSTGQLLSSAAPLVDGAHVPDGAWRLVANPNGGVLMLHQEAAVNPVSTGSGGYGSSVTQVGIVAAAAQGFVGASTNGAAVQLAQVVLPVDGALFGNALAVVAAGNAFNPLLPQVARFDLGSSHPVEMLPGGGHVQAVAVAWMPDGTLLVQSREPAALVTLRGQSVARIPLSSVSRADTGHAIFHANAGGFVACASCHLEGGDDGRAWNFLGLGPRRTPSLRFGITGTEPFHWGGEMQDLPTLAFHVFVERMSGPKLADDQLAALRHFLDALPQLPRPTVDPAAAARGQALFEDPNGAGCATCHAGPKLTNNKTLDVGTGGAFQVPSLIGVAAHPPYLHDGRAATLAARFDPKLGGGDHHGTTSQLTPSQLDDLVAYLQTL